MCLDSARGSLDGRMADVSLCVFEYAGPLGCLTADACVRAEPRASRINRFECAKVLRPLEL